MKANGFSLDDKRSTIADNDIPDIITRFHHLNSEAGRECIEQSFLVPNQEVEYIVVEYPPTSEIIGRLNELQTQISHEIDELRNLLNQ